LVDTGSTVPIISARYAKQIGLHHRASDKYKLNSVDAKEQAIVGLTGPCELVLAKNTEFQVTIPVPEFLVVDEPHGMYDILLGQPQLYRHAIYLDPLLGIVYRPFWQSKKDGHTIHVLPSTSSATFAPSVGAASVHEVNCVASCTLFPVSVPLALQSVPSSASQGGGTLFCCSHDDNCDVDKGTAMEGEGSVVSSISDKLLTYLDDKVAVLTRDPSISVEYEVEDIVEQIFRCVVVRNVVDDIFRNIVERYQLCQLWIGLGKDLRLQVAQVVRAEHNRCEKRNNPFPCLLEKETGNALVTGTVWTWYGARIQGYLG